MSDKISRKRFLKQAGSALAVSTIGYPSIILPGNNDKLGVALVGLGSYSTGRLARGFDRTDIVSCGAW
ncbi:MAG: hypothetical protein U5K69_18100 [Balneolaceae bacterium]|nr:hypothetical protein [Balneolaceae bacterium]